MEELRIYASGQSEVIPLKRSSVKIRITVEAVFAP